MILESFENGTIGWSSAILSQNHVLLYITLVGVVLHCALWFQFFFHKTLYDLSFIFPICYVLTDVFLISGYLVQYGIRSRALTNTWRVSCYFEAYFMLYFNVLESFCLTALNICRYWQIVHNKKIYSVHPRLILFIYGAIPILILINMIVQDQLDWCFVIEKPGLSCSVVYKSLPVRMWNVTILFALPIILNFLTSIRCFIFLKHQHSQQVIARRKYHRQLLYRFSIFYTIWFILWLPFVLLTFLSIETISGEINFIATLGSTLEVSIDGILVGALDKRFEMAWKKTLAAMLKRFGRQRGGRIHPALGMTAVTPRRALPIIKNN